MSSSDDTSAVYDPQEKAKMEKVKAEGLKIERGRNSQKYVHDNYRPSTFMNRKTRKIPTQELARAGHDNSNIGGQIYPQGQRSSNTARLRRYPPPEQLINDSSYPPSRDDSTSGSESGDVHSEEYDRSDPQDQLIIYERKEQIRSHVYDPNIPDSSSSARSTNTPGERRYQVSNILSCNNGVAANGVA